MISINQYIEEEKLGGKKVLKIEDKPNYKVHDVKNPPEKDIKKDPKTGKPMYRTKTVYKKDGSKRLIKFAVMKKLGPEGGRTQVTSMWKEK